MTNVAAAHGKIAIRSEGAFVVAYLSTLDGKEREEIGRIHGLVVRMMPSAWEDWKGVMSRIGVAIIEASVGGKTVEMHELPPEVLESPADPKGGN